MNPGRIIDRIKRNPPNPYATLAYGVMLIISSVVAKETGATAAYAAVVALLAVIPVYIGLSMLTRTPKNPNHPSQPE